MANIKDLSGVGSKFKATLGPGSFKKKLSSATRYGDLKNLRDNSEAIIKVISSQERAIKRGGLSRSQRIAAWGKIKSIDKNITKEDRREIKQILEHLGRGQGIAKADSAKSKGGVFSGLFSNKLRKGEILTPEQKTRNILASRRSAELGGGKTGYASSQVSYGGQKIETRSRVALGQAGGGVKGTAENRFGSKRGEVGFASQKLNNPTLPSSPPPSSPPPGIGGGGMRPGF